MKKRLILIFVPLFLSTSFSSYGTDEVEYAQQIMNSFQSTIKQFQNKMKRYQQCMQGKCSQEEKAQAKAELKKAAKFVIPTALAITAIIVSAIIIKKHRPQEEVELPELTEQEMENVEKRIEEEKHTKKMNDQQSKFTNAMSENNVENFKTELENISVLSEEQRIFIAWLLVMYGSQIPEQMEMLKLLFEKDPKLVNAKKWGYPLFSTAVNQGWNTVDIFLKHNNLDVRPEVTDVADLPLLRAVQSHTFTHDDVDKILKKYTKEQLEEDIEKIRKSKIQEKETFIQRIKIKATQAGFKFDEA